MVTGQVFETAPLVFELLLESRDISVFEAGDFFYRYWRCLHVALNLTCVVGWGHDAFENVAEAAASDLVTLRELYLTLVGVDL